jgi:outer membrane protein assembly factor BamB
MNPLAQGDGLVYGCSGSGEFRAADPATGKVVWETTQPTIGEGDPRNWYTAFVTPWQPNGAAQPRHYFIANEDGDLIVARMDRQGYAELSRAHLIEPANTDASRPVVWSHPAYANRSVYWRNDKELVRASLAAE